MMTPIYSQMARKYYTHTQKDKLKICEQLVNMDKGYKRVPCIISTTFM